MTSKNSLSEKAAGGVGLFKLLTKIIRRNIWLPLLALIGFLLNLPVATALIYNAIDNEDKFETFKSPYFAEDVMLAFQICSSLIIIVGAVLAAVTLFRYLHVRSQVDFYHSLPVRREKFFAANWLAGFLVFFVPYAAAQLLNLIMLAVFGMITYLPMDMYFAYILFNMLGYALMFSLTVLAMLLSGNMPGALKILASIYGLCPAVAGLFTALAGIFYANYVAFSDTLTNGLLHASVLERYCWVSWFSFEGNAAICVQDWLIGILLLAATLAVSVLLYQKRRSECAGSTLAFRWQKALFKYPYVLLFGLLGGILFYAMGNMDFLWAAFGAIIATLFMAQLMEIFVNSDFRAIRRGWRAALCSVLVVGVILAYFGMDLGGFDKWQAEADAVESVQVSSTLLNLGTNDYYNDRYNWYAKETYWRWSSSDYAEKVGMITFSDPANVAALVSILNSDETQYECLYNENDYYRYYSDAQYCEVVYHMKNGGSKVRSVFCGGVAANEQAYLTLLASDEWRGQLFLNSGEFDGRNVLLQDLYSFVNVGNSSFFAPELSEAQSKAFYETYKREYDALSAEELLKSLPLGRVQVGFYTEKRIDAYGIVDYGDLEYWTLYIYPGMTETIEKLQYIYGEDALDTSYPAGKIASVREMRKVMEWRQDEGDLPYYVSDVYETEEVRTLDPATDAAEIAKIYAATASEEQLSYAGYYGMTPFLAETYYEFTYRTGAPDDYEYAVEHGYEAAYTEEAPQQVSEGVDTETIWTEDRYPIN